MQSIASLMSMKAPVEEDIGNLEDFDESHDQPDGSFDRTEASIKISELAQQIGLLAELAYQDDDVKNGKFWIHLCRILNPHVVLADNTTTSLKHGNDASEVNDECSKEKDVKSNESPKVLTPSDIIPVILKSPNRRSKSAFPQLSCDLNDEEEDQSYPDNVQTDTSYIDKHIEGKLNNLE